MALDMELVDTGEGVIQYLEAMCQVRRSMVVDHSRFKYLGMEDYLLKHGRLFKSSPLTKAEMTLVRKARGLHRPEEKQCFYNSQLVAQLCPEFIYCEGVAISIIPTHHGWLTLNGKVVDLTWQNMVREPRKFLPDYNLGTFVPPFQYFGLAMPGADWLKWWKSRGKTCVPVLDDWERGWPVLQGVPLETVVPRKKLR